MFCKTKDIFSGDTADNTKTYLTGQLARKQPAIY